MTIDESLRARFTAAVEARHGGDVAGGGRGPHDPGMEMRMSAVEAGIGRLEAAFVRVESTLATLATKADLAKVDDRVRKLEVDLGKLDGRISQLPTTIAIFAYMGGLVTLSLAIGGVAFLLLRSAGGH